MASWRDVPSDVLQREWSAALSAEVGDDMLHADLGRRLVELAAEMDRRILAGERSLLQAARGSSARLAVVPTALADAGWLTTYITRAAMASSARAVGGDVRRALAENRRTAAVRRDGAGSGGAASGLAATSRDPEPGVSAAR